MRSTSKIAGVLTVVLGCLVVAGCGRKPASGTGAASSNQPPQNALTAPVDYMGAVGQAKVHAEKVVDLASVRQALQMYHAAEGKFPATLQELVSSGYLRSLPQLPPGYKWEYNPQTGEVRVVRPQPQQ